MERKKIKVLRIINRFNIGGPTYNATFLTKFIGDEFETLLVGGLPEEGEADSLFVLDRYGVEPELISEMVREPSLISDWKAYRKLKKIIREYQPDIVHTHASKAGALGRKAAHSCNVPVIVHTFHGHVFHSYFGKLKTELFKWIERRLAKKSTGIIAISETQKKELSLEHKICSENKIREIQLGFDLEPFHQKRISERDNVRREYKIDEGEVAIAIIGRLAPIKDHDFFLDVIADLLAKVSVKVKIFIVGDGSEYNRIKERVDILNKQFSNELVMTSWIQDIGTFNAGMDLICLTSKNEGTPVSLIEAQAGNIPVISTDVGGVKDVVQDGKTGYIIPLNDREMFVEKLQELCENKKKREIMSQNGWNFVKSKFHYTTLAENMRNYYHELLENETK